MGLYCSISFSMPSLSVSSHLSGVTFSWSFWNSTNRAGTMSTWSIMPMSIPPIEPVPRARLPLAPAPVANIMGRRPMIMASEVMRMGRRRAVAPWMAALTTDMPVRRRSTANSTIRMAFLARRPISMMSAICR